MNKPQLLGVMFLLESLYLVNSDGAQLKEVAVHVEL